MAWSSSPFSLVQKGFSLFNRDVLHDAMFDAVILMRVSIGLTDRRKTAKI